MKYCGKCNQDKSLDEFWNNRNTKDGKQSLCKECCGKSPSKSPDKRRAYSLKTRYGLTEDQFLTLLVLQDSTCAICQRDLEPSTQRSFRSLAVDHDHSTGKVRGLLCHACNAGLGHFDDSKIRLQQALNYLVGK